jgi:hypothetical protein
MVNADEAALGKPGEDRFDLSGEAQGNFFSGAFPM